MRARATIFCVIYLQLWGDLLGVGANGRSWCGNKITVNYISLVVKGFECNLKTDYNYLIVGCGPHRRRFYYIMLNYCIF